MQDQSAEMQLCFNEELSHFFPDFRHRGQVLDGYTYGSIVSAETPAQIKSLKTALKDGQSFFAAPANFSPKACFFDMDATVIHEESIVVLAEAAGKGPEVDRITEEAMCGRIDFTEALEARVATLEGLPNSVFQEALEKITLQPGIEALTNWLHQQNIPCYLVSGGFHQLADPVGKKLGFAGVRANNLETKSNHLTGRVYGPIIDGEAKAAYLRELKREKNWQKNDLMAVGDGANDCAMMKEVMLGVGFHPKPALVPELTGINRSGTHVLMIEYLKSLSSAKP